MRISLIISALFATHCDHRGSHDHSVTNSVFIYRLYLQDSVPKRGLAEARQFEVRDVVKNKREMMKNKKMKKKRKRSRII